MKRLDQSTREPATLIVLAGGKSSRMGQDKSLLPVLGKPMIQHLCEQAAPYFDEMLISAAEGRRYAFLKIPVVRDAVPGQGPLRGIASALAVSKHDLNFVMACDIPWTDGEFILSLLRDADGVDCVVPVSAEGHYEPLFAVYRKSALPAMLRALEEGERRVADAFPYCQVRTAPVPPQVRLSNINTMRDYRRLVRSLESTPEE